MSKMVAIDETVAATSRVVDAEAAWADSAQAEAAFLEEGAAQPPKKAPQVTVPGRVVAAPKKKVAPKKEVGLGTALWGVVRSTAKGTRNALRDAKDNAKEKVADWWAGDDDDSSSYRPFRRPAARDPNDGKSSGRGTCCSTPASCPGGGRGYECKESAACGKHGLGVCWYGR